MAAQKGRDLLIKVGDNTASPEAFNTLAGGQSRGGTINNEQVDISNATDGRWRKLLGAAGITSMSLNFSGVFLDDTAFADVEGYARDATLQTYQFVVPDWGTYEGEFQVSNFEQTGEHNGAVMFSCTFESSGTVGFTAA